MTTAASPPDPAAGATAEQAGFVAETNAAISTALTPPLATALDSALLAVVSLARLVASPTLPPVSPLASALALVVATGS